MRKCSTEIIKQRVLTRDFSEQFETVHQLVEQLRYESSSQKELIAEQQRRLDEQQKLLQTLRETPK